MRFAFLGKIRHLWSTKTTAILPEHSFCIYQQSAKGLTINFSVINEQLIDVVYLAYEAKMNLLSNSEKLISNAKTFLWQTSRLIPMLEQNCNGFGHPKVPDFTKKCKPHQFYYYGVVVKIQSAIDGWPFEILI